MQDAELSREERMARNAEARALQREIVLRREQELSEARETLRQLGTVHNDLQLFRMLPDEILGNIMCVACEDDDDYYFEAPGYLHPLWLSQVCHRWRAVALGTANLWTRITLDSRLKHSSIAEAFRQRAKAAPLHVELRAQAAIASAPTLQSLTRQLLLCTPTTRHLDIMTDYSAMFSFVTALRNAPATMLEKLTMRLKGGGSEDLEPETQSLCAHFRDMFVHKVPQLRFIHIGSVPISWQAPILRGGKLTHLTITHQEVPDLGDVLEILRANPLLEEVTFAALDREGSFAPRVAEYECPQQDSERIILPRLRYLSLRDLKLDYPGLIANLTTPANIDISQDCTYYKLMGDGDGLEDLLLTPSRAIQRLPAFSGEDVLSMYYYQHLGDYAVSYARSIHNLDWSLEVEGLVKLRISIQTESEWSSQIFGSLGTAIHLRNLRALNLSVVSLISDTDDTWARLFDRVPSLTDLILSRCDLQRALPPLTNIVNASWPSQQRRMSCPQLESLKLLIYESGGTYHVSQDDIAALHACCWARKDVGIPLKVAAVKRSAYGYSYFSVDTQRYLAQIDEDMEVAVGLLVRRADGREVQPGENWEWRAVGTAGSAE